MNQTDQVKSKSRRGRPKGSRNKNKKRSPKDFDIVQVLKSMNKKDLKKVLDQFKMDGSNGSDSESKSKSQSVSDDEFEEDNTLETYYNEVQQAGEDEEVEELERDALQRYLPSFIDKRINLNDKSQFDFKTMKNIVHQISRDKCSKMEAQRRVCEYLNKFYAVVTNQGHETIMVAKIYKPEFGFCELSEISMNSFKSNFSNLDVVYVLPNQKVKVRKLGEFYIESPCRLNYTRIVFNPYPVNHPNAASENELNTFFGMPFTEDDCRKCYDDPKVRQKMEWIRSQYIQRTVCNKDDFAFQVFEHWFGAKIKEPWKKLNWMVLFYGGFGSGKSTLMRKIIKVIFGIYCKVISDIKAVVGEFDSIKRNALIIMLDENVAPETKAQEAKLTSEITSNMITSNEKFKRIEQVVSFHEYIGGVNPKNKVFLKLGDRRVFVIKTNEEMTLSHQWEKEKVEYWNKVNEYLDDIKVVKAYQYHLQFMLVPNSNIKIGLHAPYSKIKDDLMLLQSPDSLAFAKAIVERGFIVPQSRLSDNKPELVKHYTNTQGRIWNQKTTKYDSPWVREICTKDVESEFRLMFPHSPMKNHTLWRELCFIFDIKTSEEERIEESANDILMTRFHKNPNVKTKITNAIAFKPSLIKKIADKNGKLKNKIYYLWPNFYDAYTQFTSKTKIIIELTPRAKEMFENERNAITNPKANNNNDDSNNNSVPAKRKRSEEISIDSNSDSIDDDDNGDQKQNEQHLIDKRKSPDGPLKKRRIVHDSAPLITEAPVPQIDNAIASQLKVLMEEVQATREQQKKIEQAMEIKLAQLQSQPQPHVQVQSEPQPHPQAQLQVQFDQPRHESPIQVQDQQQQHQQQQQQLLQQEQFYQFQEPSNVNGKRQRPNKPKATDQYMPYPVQKVISVFNIANEETPTATVTTTTNNNNMHFDTQHQSQEMVEFDGINNRNPATLTSYQINEDSCDVPMISLATPIMEEVDPNKVQGQLQHQQHQSQNITPKRITTTRMFKALNSN
jgi:hypothetical protein